MSRAGHTPSSTKPDLEDPIDAFLSEADEPQARVSSGDSLESPARLQSIAALIPGSREVWVRALLVSAGLAMVVAAAVMVLVPAEPAEQVQQVMPVPFLSVVPTPGLTSPASPATQPIEIVPAAKTETEAGSAEGARGVAIEASSKDRDDVLPASTASPESTRVASERARVVDMRPSPLLPDDESPVVSLPPSAVPPRNEVTAVAELTPAAAVITPPAPRDLGVADRLSSDQTAITTVLGAYQKSYSALDAETASTIWQGLDVRALRRAFSTLTSQDLSFDRCDVQVVSDSAKATCTGTLNYVRKIGDDGPHERRLSWTIDLRRHGDRWLIANVLAR